MDRIAQEAYNRQRVIKWAQKHGVTGGNEMLSILRRFFVCFLVLLLSLLVGMAALAEESSQLVSLLEVAPPYQSNRLEVFSPRIDPIRTIHMAAKEYSEGIAFIGRDGVQSNAYALFNLKGRYKTLTLTLGHVNGYKNGAGTLVITGDTEKLLYTQELTVDSYPLQVTIDVTNVYMLKFQINPMCWESAVGITEAMLEINPNASPIECFSFDMMDTNGAYQFSDCYQSFSAALSATLPEGGYFTMAGDRYVNGFLFKGRDGVGLENVYALFDLDGQFSGIEFTLGHIDRNGSRDETMELIVYGDGEVLSTYELNDEIYPQRVSLDTSGIHQLKFSIPYLTWAMEFGFADVRFIP